MQRIIRKELNNLYKYGQLWLKYRKLCLLSELTAHLSTTDFVIMYVYQV